MIYEYSRTGARHAASGVENQDAIRFGRNERYSAIALADGVSACSEARAGAELASGELVRLLLKTDEQLRSLENRQLARFLLSRIRYQLEQRAAQEGCAPEEYSSTAAAALWDRQENRLLCFNLGDGMILAQGGGSRILAMPSDSAEGCCSTTTQGACRMTELKLVDSAGLQAVLICSDGAWRQLFHKTRLKPEASALLEACDWAGLEAYLAGQDCADDCSFVSLELRPNLSLERGS